MVKKILLLFTSLVFIVTLFLSKAERQNIDMQSDMIHEVVFFEEGSFYEGVNYVEKQELHKREPAYGGIVPHHLYPSFIIAEFFRILSQQNPKTIILIGPNHKEAGEFVAITSRFHWKTLFGVIEPDKKIINSLLGSDLVQVDDEVMKSEHSVVGMMPFVKYFLPSTKVVPIILSGFMSKEKIQILSDEILKLIDKDTVIVSAVDFSHNLNSFEAKEKDEITWQLIEKHDYEKILSLGNEYLDSPPSIVLLLMLMKERGRLNGKVLQHTNSGELQKNYMVETTSYYSVIY